MADMSNRDLPDLAGAIEKLGVHDHLCLIYETQEEQFSAVIPFMKIGLERGEKCLYVVDDNTADMVINGMKAAGMDVEAAIASGKLSIVSKQDAYLKQGYFDPDWMIGFLKQATDEAKAAGFTALRITGEMTWVLGGAPGTERVMEYEAKLNYYFPENDALAICQYNRSRFSPEIIKNVIATHPLVISGGMVCRNFYYVPPDDFLGQEQSSREIDRFLTNIRNREKVEEELRQHRERLEELVKERTAELRRMNDRFALAVDAARLGVWDWDIRKNELIWDDMMYTLYGIRRDDFAGAYEAWLQGVHPDDRARSNEISKRAQRGEQEYDTEFRVVWPDGSIHYLKAYGRIVRDADGNAVRMIGVNYDITKRRRVEELQRQSEEKYRRLLDTIQEGIWVIDKESITTFVNPRMAEMLGYAPADMIGKPLFAFMDEQGKLLAERNVERRKQGIKEQHDFEFIRKDGERIYSSLETGPILDESGQYAGAIAAVADISERRKAEEEVLRLNEELEQRVRERTKELERRNYELEQMNKAFVGRELKMVELKEKIRELETKKTER